MKNSFIYKMRATNNYIKKFNNLTNKEQLIYEKQMENIFIKKRTIQYLRAIKLRWGIL